MNDDTGFDSTFILEESKIGGNNNMGRWRCRMVMSRCMMVYGRYWSIISILGLPNIIGSLFTCTYFHLGLHALDRWYVFQSESLWPLAFPRTFSKADCRIGLPQNDSDFSLSKVILDIITHIRGHWMNCLTDSHPAITEMSLTLTSKLDSHIGKVLGSDCPKYF